MGLMDGVRAREAAQQGIRDAGRHASAAQVAACPGNHYQTEVNKGSIRMQSWQAHLNDMYQSGYKLAHVLEQDGNTVQVYEHHFH